MSEKKKLTAYVVSHTHWDREWRYSIWKTRLMLVEMMDELIDNLESGRYKSFLMDGQIAPILDYLEICPEKKDLLKKLIASGQIEVGPWYTLPDEYPVDGEALVRNLLWGDRVCKEFGGNLKIGYTPFGWGQTAQLPQIYQGFGIDVAMIGKRVNKQRAPKSEFLWRAPDGSEMLTTRFGEGGRNNFYFKIHLSSLFGIYHEGPDWYYKWSKGGTPFHRIDKENTEQDFCVLNAPDKWYPETITPELIQETWDTTNESVIENDRLMMNGTDYAPSQALFPEMLERINQLDRDNNRQWIQVSMREFVELMKEKIDLFGLPVVDGELRDGPASGVTGNALTTRLYVKSLNKKAENKLIKFAEPLNAMASMLGVQTPRKMMQLAWQYLLQSQPHDSVNGVTQDKTVLDVENRLLQVIDLAETVGEQALKELVKKIDLSAFSEDDVLVVVFNPSPYARKEIVEAYIDMPDEQTRLPGWTIDEREWVQLYDNSGVVGSQCMGYTKENSAVTEIHTRAFPYLSLRFHVYFNAGEIPAGGYKVFKAVMRTDEVGEGDCWSNPLARTGTLLKSPDMMENEFLRVTMNGDGTFNLFDKELNREFRDLNYYEDRGEFGDYWINKHPMFDQKFSSRGCKAKKWCVEDGPLQTTLVSEIQMDIPSQGIPQQQRRGDNIVPLVIWTSVTLKAGQRYVEVNVEFENQHENHYLRAMFPTGITEVEYADAGGHFTVDRRPIRPQGPTDYSVWPDMATLPYKGFVDVSDGRAGMAFMDNCLAEYEVLENDEEKTVALSLLRSVKNWICTEYRVGSNFPSQKGGQCFGKHSVRYAIMPHKGNWQQANVPAAGENFNVPVCPVQTRKHEGTLPAESVSLFAMDNDSLRFSAIKKCEDRDTFIVRIYNLTNELQKGSIRLGVELSQAWLTNLNEERMSEVKLTDKNAVSIEVAPQKITTIEIRVKK